MEEGARTSGNGEKGAGYASNDGQSARVASGTNLITKFTPTHVVFQIRVILSIERDMHGMRKDLDVSIEMVLEAIGC